MGSHQDSVREGGAYDGIMGVILPVLELMKLCQRGMTLPFAVEVLAFADDKGVRFPNALPSRRGRYRAPSLTDPDVRISRIRFLMVQFRSSAAPLMHDPGGWQGVPVQHLLHSAPIRLSRAASPRQRGFPDTLDLMEVPPQTPPVARDPVVGIVTLQHLAQSAVLGF